MPDRVIELAARQARTGELTTQTFSLQGRESAFEIELNMDVAVMKTRGSAFDIDVERSEDNGSTWIHVSGSKGWTGSDNVDRTDRHGRKNRTPIFRCGDLGKWNKNLFRIVMNFKASTAVRIVATLM